MVFELSAPPASGAAIGGSIAGSAANRSLLIDHNNHLAQVVSSYNVKGFGALGDGATDDTAAFTAAITAAGVNGSIIVPPGAYRISNITLLAGQTLFGCGRNVTVLQMISTATGTMVTCPLGQTNVISDLTLDGQNAGTSFGIAQQTSPANQSAISISSIDRSCLRHLYITGFRNYAINCPDTSRPGAANNNLIIFDVVIFNCWTGIEMSQNSEYVKILGCDITGCQFGVETSAGNLNMAGTTITYCWDNVHVFGPGAGNDGHGSITGCEINHAKNYAIYFDTLTYGFNVSGGSIMDGSIYIKSCKGVYISGCALDVVSVLLDGGGYNEIRNCHNTGDYGNNVQHNYNAHADSTVIYDWRNTASNALIDGTGATHAPAGADLVLSGGQGGPGGGIALQTSQPVAGTARLSAVFVAASHEFYSAPSSATLQVGSGDFGIHAEVMLTDKSTWYDVVSKDNGTNGGIEYKLRYNPTADRFSFMMSDGTTFFDLHADALGSPVAGVWYTIRAWFTGATTKIMNIVVNDGAANTLTGPTTPITAGAAVFNIGAETSNFGYMNGRIRTVGIYKGGDPPSGANTLYSATAACPLFAALTTAQKTALAEWFDNQSVAEAGSAAATALTSSATPPTVGTSPQTYLLAETLRLDNLGKIKPATGFIQTTVGAAGAAAAPPANPYSWMQVTHPDGTPCVIPMYRAS